MFTRDDILHGLFATACEGGINYWAAVGTYRWSKNGDGETDDLENFRAVILDAEGEGFGGDEHLDELTIDRKVMEKGLALYAAQERRPGSYWDEFIQAVRKGEWDDCDYDADIADSVVQLGLFGEVRFG